MTDHTPEQRDRLDRWRVLRDLQIRISNYRRDGANYASHTDHRDYTDAYYDELRVREEMPAGEYAEFIVWREAGDAHMAKMGTTLDQAIAAAEANYQDVVDGEFAGIVAAEPTGQTEYEIHYTTDVANGRVIIDRPDTYADCLSVLDGIVKALETVPGMHAQIEPTTPYAQLFVYGMTSNGWARIGRYTIAENDHDSR